MKKYLVAAVVVWSWVLGVAIAGAQPSSPNSLSGEKIIIGSNTGVQIYNKGSGEISLKSNINSAAYGLTVNDTTVELGKSASGTAWTVEADGDLAVGATGGNIVMTTGAIGQSAVTGVSAAGSTISDATQLSKVSNNVTVAAAGTGVKLFDAATGATITVRNESSVFVPLNVYPPTASISINSRSNGTPYVLAHGESGQFTKVSSVLWIAQVGINQEVSNSVSAAGTTLGTATALGNPINNVTTVASGTGVLLYEAPIGTRIVVRNGGNFMLSVYPPTASGTINNLSAGVAYTLNTQAVATFSKLTATVWIAEAGVSQGFENAISAAGTIITDATDLARQVNNITTVGAGAGVQLFQAPVGLPIYVRNGDSSGSDDMNVWPPDASSNINAGSNGAAVILAVGETGVFIRMTATAWIGMVGVAF